MRGGREDVVGVEAEPGFEVGVLGEGARGRRVRDVVGGGLVEEAFGHDEAEGAREVDGVEAGEGGEGGEGDGVGQGDEFGWGWGLDWGEGGGREGTCQCQSG